jgi:L-arabinokinase
MGGVADYAGALVVEAASKVATTVIAEPASALVIGPASLDTKEIARLARLDYISIRAELNTLPKWVLYPLGVALVLVRHGIIEPPAVELHVTSDVPQAVGVSSSAALEVATARALTGSRLDSLRLAFLCQEAENSVVGAPCGAMDQITAAVGTPGKILPILCRPGQPRPLEQLPPQLEVVGWPTGTEHDVTGLPYRRARTAAFIGKRLIEQATGHHWTWISELPSELVSTLPEVLAGESFPVDLDGTGEALAAVEPGVDYPVREATAFGSAEHQRSQRLLAAIRRSDLDQTRAIFVTSHAGYDAIGLGHPAADRVVTEALDRPTVYGARSSGGGSGGTVAVLCARGSLDDIDGLIR